MIEASRVATRNLIRRGGVHSAILAGGFGTRLDAVADPSLNKWAVAKPAAPVGNLRIIEFGIRALRSAGIEELNLLVCHLPETLRHVIGNGKIYGENVSVRELIEQPTDPLDTAGAVGRLVHSQGWAENPQDLVIVPSADVIHTVDLEEVIDVHLFNKEKHGAVATIVVNQVPWQTVDRFGTVRLDGMPERGSFKTDEEFEDAVGAWLIDRQATSLKIDEFREKKSRFLQTSLPESRCYKEVALSNLNNSSIYVFNASFFTVLFTMLTKRDNASPLVPELYEKCGPTPFSDWGKHIFNWLTSEEQKSLHPIFAYILPIRSYWRDAGIGEELRQANMDVLDGRLETGIPESEGRFWHRVGEDSWRGNNVYVDGSAHISHSIIGDNVIIGPNTRIVHSVVGSGTRVEAGAQLYGTVVFPKHRDKKEPNLVGVRTVR